MAAGKLDLYRLARRLAHSPEGVTAAEVAREFGVTPCTARTALVRCEQLGWARVLEFRPQAPGRAGAPMLVWGPPALDGG